jgi:hypothetical protein
MVSKQGLFFIQKAIQACHPTGFRAGDETRTRDPQLGRLMLYQLSYSRMIFQVLKD